MRLTTPFTALLHPGKVVETAASLRSARLLLRARKQTFIDPDALPAPASPA